MSEFEFSDRYHNDQNYIKSRDNIIHEVICFDVEENKLTKFIMKKQKYLII